MRHFLVLLGIALFALGCSSSTPLGSQPGSAHLAISMSLTVKAGEELHQCQLVTLPTDTDVEIVTFSHHYTKGSHHFLVYATKLDAIPPDMTGQYDCVNGDEPIMQQTTGILYGAQSPEATFRLPAGVGYRMKAHQVLMLQSHYLNPTAADIEAAVTAGFDTAPAEAIEQQAAYLLYYNPFIYVPARGTSTSGIRCSVPRDIQLLSGLTHYHQRGTAMRVWVDSSMTEQNETPFHETHDWEHPVDFRGPLLVKGGSALRVQCDYANGDAVDVFQGPNAATSEMCVFAGLYYPKIDGDFDNCSDLSIKGTGTQKCFDVLTCVSSCPPNDAPVFTQGGVNVGPCWEKCVASGCDGAVDGVLPVSICAGEQCSAECERGQDSCSQCTVSKCSSQVNACLAKTCGG